MLPGPPGSVAAATGREVLFVASRGGSHEPHAPRLAGLGAEKFAAPGGWMHRLSSFDSPNQYTRSKEIGPIVSSSEDLCDLLCFEDPELRRATSVGELTSWAGRILDPRKRTPAGFNRSRPVERIDTFISHNWAVGRWQKFPAIALYFNSNLGLAAAVLTIIGGWIWVQVTGAPGWNGALHGLTTPVMLATIFLGRNVATFVGLPGPSIFFDVCCIHQTDKAKQRKGIEKLGAFMRSSENLLVCFSDLYLQKMWTVYEVAAFIVVNEVSRMHVVPMEVPMFALVISAVHWVLSTLFLRAVFLLLDKNITYLEHWLAIAGTAVIVGMTVMAVPARRFFLRLSSIQESVKAFDVRTAKCAFEDDREYVENSIVQLMRHVRMERKYEVSRDSLLEDFNAFVRSEVPKAIRCSTGPIGFPLKYILLFFFVPLTTTLLEASVYFNYGDPVPLVLLRCLTTALLVPIWGAHLLVKHPHLSGLRHIAHVAFAVLTATGLFVALVFDWEVWILLFFWPYHPILRPAVLAWRWVRVALLLLLSNYLLRWRVKEEPISVLELVAEPDIDTFEL